MTDGNAHITCIGLANVDVIATVGDDFIETHGIAKGASTVLDACTTGTILGKLQKPVFFPGGGAANAACGLADLGLGVRFIGKTGDDIYGDIFRDGFAGRAITTPTRPYAPKMTSTCLTLVTPDKDRSFAFCTDTAGWFIFPHDLPEDATEFTYMEANTACMPPDGQENLLRAAVRKYENTSKIIINLNDREIIANGRAVLQETLGHNVYFYISNVQEFCALFDVATADEAWDKARSSGRNFAITNGAQDVQILFEGQIYNTPAQPIAESQIVNTVGAGDQFAAGFIAGLAQGKDIADAAHQGVGAATRIIQEVSARPPMKPGKKQAAS